MISNARGRLNMRVLSNPDASWRKRQRQHFREVRKVETRTIVWAVLRSVVVVIGLFALAMKLWRGALDVSQYCH